MEASSLRFFSQQSIILDFTLVLKNTFVGGFARVVIGSGKEFSEQISWTCRNHDLEDGLAEEKVEHASCVGCGLGLS